MGWVLKLAEKLNNPIFYLWAPFGPKEENKMGMLGRQAPERATSLGLCRPCSSRGLTEKREPAWRLNKSPGGRLSRTALCPGIYGSLLGRGKVARAERKGSATAR